MGIFFQSTKYAPGFTRTANSGNTSFPTTNQYGDATSITLVPGEYDITACVECFSLSGVTSYKIGISTTSGNSSTGLSNGDNVAIIAGLDNDVSLSIPNYRVAPTSTTTYYLKVLSTYSASAPLYTYRFSVRQWS